ncbi:hypothetical protein FMM75_22595 [Lachnospiraceae bacterium MD335]|nr:hypothetical protein [Lachnospiraceae bacterium MD335]
MLAEERNRRQKELEKEIYQLSERLLQADENRRVALELLDIYKGDFRHSYSDFFPIIIEISKDDTKYNLEYLSENMEAIRQYIEENYIQGKDEFNEIRAHIYKLCDHLNLEIGRWSYYSQYEQKINDSTLQAVSTTQALKKAEEELKEASEKAGSMQTELIAVLSIFAAIVITFSGGFSVFGNIMESIGSAQHYEMVVLVAIIGALALFDTIFMLMYLVSKIINRNIYARCMTKDCTCDTRKCGGIRRLRKRLPYVFYFNIFSIVGIIVDCVVWLMDIKGIL